MSLPKISWGSSRTITNNIEPIYSKLFEIHFDYKDHTIFRYITDNIYKYELSDNHIKLTCNVQQDSMFEDFINYFSFVKNIYILMYYKQGIFKKITLNNIEYKSIGWHQSLDKEDVVSLNITLSFNELKIEE